MPHNCGWFSSSNGSCWAANPSPLDTHWYVNTCGYYNKTGGGGNASGSYYNYDFLDDQVATYVSQMADITLLSGVGAVWGWDHTDWGEASYLIHGSLTVTGSNTCF